MNNVRVRFGMKTGSWLFPNAAVFVFYTTESRFADLWELAKQVREVLVQAGQGGLADKLVCERSN